MCGPDVKVAEKHLDVSFLVEDSDLSLLNLISNNEKFYWS